MNPPDIQKLLAGPDPALQQAQFLDIGLFAIGLVISVVVVAMAVSALRALLTSKVSANEKLVWVIIILAIPVIGPCVFYVTRKKVLPRR